MWRLTSGQEVEADSGEVSMKNNTFFLRSSTSLWPTTPKRPKWPISRSLSARYYSQLTERSLRPQSRCNCLSYPSILAVRPYVRRSTSVSSYMHVTSVIVDVSRDLGHVVCSLSLAVCIGQDLCSGDVQTAAAVRCAPEMCGQFEISVRRYSPLFHFRTHLTMQ